MSKLFVPDIGTHLRLTKAWKPKIQNESRNSDFLKKHGHDVTFPKDSLLAVDRIYIRKGARDYSSITFRSLTEPKGRFWVKLKYANQIEFKLEENHTVQYVIIDLKNQDSYQGKLSSITKSNLAKRMREIKYGISFFEIFMDDVWPELSHKWKRDGYRSIQPINKRPFMKTRNTRDWYSGLSNPPEKYFDSWEAGREYEKDFMTALKKVKKYKNLTELLDQLPPRYEFKKIVDVIK